MKLVYKYCLKSINIYIKINFIIIFSILIFQRSKIANKIKALKENNHYYKERNNKKNKEIKNYRYYHKRIKENNITFKSNKEKNLIKKRKRKVGIIGLTHHKNVGNNLLKFAIYIQLKKLGLEPYIIGKHKIDEDIRFLNRTTHPRIIKNFNEIKKKDYDILMVNSDQTWRKWSSDFYNIAFLKFSRNWDVPKFIYGASTGLDYWPFSKEIDKIAKYLLKNFTGISFREMSTVKYAKEHLGLNSTFVLDPTMLIDKKYYMEIINNYKNNNNLSNLKDYILIYKLDKMRNMESFIKRVQYQLKYKILNIKLNDNDYIEKFLHGIFHSKAVITNSYHATLFAIIFNKPFVVFLNKYRGIERFKTIKEIYGIKDRFINILQKPNLSLLAIPLKINYTSINFYRKISIEYLKKHLNII